MKISKVRIDGQFFFLEPEENVDDLKQKIVAAVLQGAAFVDFRTIGREAISVLVTPTIPVRFEVVDQSAEQVAHWGAEPPSFDIDHFDVA